ncbi:MAG: anti-sigma factor [Chthoniobacterales bacterium]
MNPDKLFDYLDGKLSPADRAEIETKLTADPQLQRQLAIAREIHRGMGSSRERQEVLQPVNDPAVAARGARLSRRVGAACAVLVLVNVLIGLAVITVKNKKPADTGAREKAIREQLSASLDAAAQSALPPPTFAAADIQLTAARSEWESVIAKVISAAEQCGGSAARGLPDDAAAVAVVDVPANRESEFRRIISAPPGVTTDTSAKPNDRSIVQVRIVEAAR